MDLSNLEVSFVFLEGWLQQWSYLCWSWAACSTGLINSSVLQGWSIKKGCPSRGCSWHTDTEQVRGVSLIMQQWAPSFLRLPAEWLYSEDFPEVEAWSSSEKGPTPPLMTGSSPLTQWRTHKRTEHKRQTGILIKYWHGWKYDQNYPQFKLLRFFFSRENNENFWVRTVSLCLLINAFVNPK